MRNTLLLSSLMVAGLSASISLAQVTINEPGPVTFGGLLDLGDPDNTFRPAFATTGTAFTMGSNVTVSSATISSVNTLTWRREAAVRLQNSAFPTLNGFFRFSDLTGTFTSFSISTPTVRGFGIENFEESLAPNNRPSDLPGAAIPAGSTWDITYYEIFDDGLGADSSGSDIVFTITAFVPPPYDSGVLAGPFNAGGLPFSPDNSVVTGPTVSSALVMPSTFLVDGTATNVDGLSVPGTLRIRVRNSAYPSTWSTELRPSTSATVGASVTLAGASVVSPAPNSVWTQRSASTLRGLNIPAGSTFSFEFIDLIDNASGADYQWSNFRFRIPAAGAAAGTGTAPTAIDHGVMSNVYSTTSTAFSSAALTLDPGTVSWHKFTLPALASGVNNHYVNIWTDGTADTIIGLFDANGRALMFDDDSGIGARSALTIGSPTDTAWPILTGDQANDGRDAVGLPAGDYYVAIHRWSSSTAPFGDGFVFTPSTTTTTSNATTLFIMTNVPAPANQAVTLPLNFAGAADPFAASRTMRYSVTQGTTTLVSSTNFTAANASQNVVISIPASATGAVTIEIDGAQYLKRKVSATLTGSAQTLSAATVLPGDVDNNGEVDLTDIDLIIGDYLGTGGSTEGTVTDLDNNGEVDLTDIDLAIGNYLLGDD